MKKNRIIALVAILLVAFASCKRVDPIHETEPVTRAFYTDASGNENFPLEQFHQLGEAGDTVAQRELVDQYRKVLTANIIRQYPEITDENSICFILGSGFAKDVKSGDGKTYSGRFQNELIIILNDPSVNDTLFLACGNGMLSPLQFSDRHDFGTAERWRFTILPGEGLAHHLPELQAWAEVANDLSIPIKDKDGNVVSQEKYLNYLGRYQSYLFPYDVVDVLAGKVFNQQGQEADFERRLAEAEKAAAHTAKATKGKGKKRR
jgi:hypothetical protein